MAHYCGVWLTFEQWLHYSWLELPLTVKIGNVKLSEDEAYTLYIQNLYVVSYRTVYKVCYGGKGTPHFYGRVVYRQPISSEDSLPLTLRGRWIDAKKEFVEKLIGQKLPE